MGILGLSSTLQGQFGGNNIFELQAGNLPYADPPYLFSNYNQLNLHYRFKGFKSSVRTESFINRFNERRYLNLSQFQFGYNRKRLDITMGHYIDMLGNGLLLRSYEIPASIQEDRSYRIRH